MLSETNTENEADKLIDVRFNDECGPWEVGVNWAGFGHAEKPGTRPRCV
jgi:hypothetical protein